MKARLAIAATAILAAFAAGATDFVWTGNTQYAEDWFDNDNWTVGGEVPAEGVYPGAEDTATFNKAAALNNSTEITVGKLVLNASLTHKRDQWLTIGAIEGSGELILTHRGRLRNISGTDLNCYNNIRIQDSDGTDCSSHGSMQYIQANGATFAIYGKLLGDGHVFLTMSGTQGVNLCGDNSGFAGTVHIDSNNSNRMKFRNVQAGSENATWIIHGNTQDNGGMPDGSAGGTLKLGSLIADSRTTGNYPFRFKNLTSTAVLEIGNLNSENDIISIRMGENNNTTGHAQIKKVGTGTLELWHTGHIRGTVISNGTLLVTSADALNGRTDNSTSVNGDCAVTFMGGTLKYGRDLWTDKDNPADVTTDWSGLVKDSTDYISVDTDGKDVTWSSTSLYSNNTNAYGFVKKGDGTLLLSGSNRDGTWQFFSNETKTNYINGGTLAIKNAKRSSTPSLNAYILGTGTLRIDSDEDNGGYRIYGESAHLNEFTGTLEWANGITEADKATGFMLNNADLRMDNATFSVTANPSEPTMVMKGEVNYSRSVYVGAFRHLYPNANVHMGGQWKLRILGAKDDSYLNGAFISNPVEIIKTGSGSLAIGSGFSAPEGSSIKVNEGVFELKAGLTMADMPSYLTIASGVKFAGEGVFGAVNLSDNDVIPPALTADTDKATEFTLLTATSITGTSAAMTALLDEVNASASIKGGKWKLRRDDNGDGTFTLKCRFVKDAFIIVVR